MFRSYDDSGFSLVELLVAIVLTGVMATVVFQLFMSQSRTFEVQEQVVSMNQNLRAAMEVLQRDFRSAGFDPQLSDNFTITDVRTRDLNYNLNPNDEDSIQFTTDSNGNGSVDAGAGTQETIDYSIFDSPIATPDGVTDLARNINNGQGRQMLAEGVERLGLAYAYADDDGRIVMNPVTPAGGSPEPLWAFDSNNDNILDRAVDQNGDGVIDINDTQAGAVLPNLLSGSNQIQLNRIRAVKIWLLGRVRQPDMQYQPVNLRFKVGNRVILYPNDNIRRKLISSVVKFRNIGS